MRATTIRRGLVLAVCAMGVGSLYLVPTLARSPAQLAQPQLQDEPTLTPVSTAPSAQTPDVAAGTGARTENPVPRPTPVSTTRTRPVIAPAAATTEPPPSVPMHRPKPRATGATAFKPGPAHDDQPPEAVPSVRPPQVTRYTLDLAWAPATDNVGVVGYKIWLNGFPVATTSQTHATVRWFNDDAVQHAVQIRAVDAVGNQSNTSPTIVVTRPPAVSTPAPSLEPSPASTPTPTAPNEPANEPAPPAATSSSTPDVAE